LTRKIDQNKSITSVNFLEINQSKFFNQQQPYFLRAKAATALVHLSHRNSVCLSVCPSVCPSQGWISQKRCKLESPNLVSETVKLFHKLEGGHPKRGH